MHGRTKWHAWQNKMACMAEQNGKSSKSIFLNVRESTYNDRQMIGRM